MVLNIKNDIVVLNIKSRDKEYKLEFRHYNENDIDIYVIFLRDMNNYIISHGIGLTIYSAYTRLLFENPLDQNLRKVILNTFDTIKNKLNIPNLKQGMPLQ